MTELYSHAERLRSALSLAEEQRVALPNVASAFWTSRAVILMSPGSRAP